MNKEQAIKYLLNVLTKWNVFCSSHRKFKQAIEVLVKESVSNDNSTDNKHKR